MRLWMAGMWGVVAAAWGHPGEAPSIASETGPETAIGEDLAEIRADPASPYARGRLALRLHDLGLPEAAIEVGEAGTLAAPADPLVWGVLCGLHAHQDTPIQGVEACRRAVTLDPGDGSTLLPAAETLRAADVAHDAEAAALVARWRVTHHDSASDADWYGSLYRLGHEEALARVLADAAPGELMPLRIARCIDRLGVAACQAEREAAGHAFAEDHNDWLRAGDLELGRGRQDLAVAVLDALLAVDPGDAAQVARRAALRTPLGPAFVPPRAGEAPEEAVARLAAAVIGLPGASMEDAVVPELVSYVEGSRAPALPPIPLGGGFSLPTAYAMVRALGPVRVVPVDGVGVTVTVDEQGTELHYLVVEARDGVGYRVQATIDGGVVAAAAARLAASGKIEAARATVLWHRDVADPADHVQLRIWEAAQSTRPAPPHALPDLFWLMTAYDPLVMASSDRSAVLRVFAQPPSEFADLASAVGLSACVATLRTDLCAATHTRLARIHSGDPSIQATELVMRLGREDGEAVLQEAEALYAANGYNVAAGETLAAALLDAGRHDDARFVTEEAAGLPGGQHAHVQSWLWNRFVLDGPTDARVAEARALVAVEEPLMLGVFQHLTAGVVLAESDDLDGAFTRYHAALAAVGFEGLPPDAGLLRGMLAEYAGAPRTACAAYATVQPDRRAESFSGHARARRAALGCAAPQ